MALTPEQLNNIQEALTALGVNPGGEATLAPDVQKGVEALIGLINDVAEKPEDKIDYDVSKGYTEELRDKLSESLGAARSSLKYQALKILNNPLGRAELSKKFEELGLPEPIVANPNLFFKLIDNSEDVISALEQAREDGILGVTSSPTVTPAPPPATPPAPPPATPPAPPPVTPPAPPPVTPPAPPPVEPEPSLEEAENAVETALGGLTPKMADILGLEPRPGLLLILNEQIAKKIQEQRDNGVPDFLIESVAGDLMGLELPTDIDVGGDFGWKSQAGLQGVMIVLGHPQVLDMNTQLPHLQPWEYHPDKGQFLLRDENITKIMEYMGETEGLTPEQLELKRQETKDMVEGLVKSLDVMYREGALLDFQIFNGSLMEVSPYAKGILLEETGRLSGLAGGNDLFNELTRAYTGIGLDQILDEGLAPEFADSPNEFRERLKAFYSQAKAAHTGTDEEFEAEMLVMLYSITSLPFGDERHRDIFVSGVMDAVRSGDADAFVEGVEQTVGTMVEEAGKPEFSSALVRNPTLHPKLQDGALRFSVGGEDFSTDDIINAYNEMSKGYRNNNGGAMTFRADRKMYISAVEVRSNIFTIEEINGEKLNEIFFTQEKLEEIAPEYAGQTLSQKERNAIFCDLLYTKANVAVLEGSGSTIATSIFTDEKIAAAMAADAGFAMMFQSPTMDSQNVVKLWASYPDFMMAVNDVKTPYDDNKISPLDDVISRAQPSAAPLASDVPPVRIAPPRVEASRSAPDPNSKPFTVEEFKANSVKLQGLSDMAAKLYTRPTLLSAKDVAFLRSQNGPTDGLGANGLLEVPLAAVDASAITDDTQGPVIGYYDRALETIVMVPLPDEFRDPAKADALMEAVKKHGMNSKQHYDYMMERFPTLAKITEASLSSMRGEGRDSGVRNYEDEYFYFSRNIQGIVESLQNDLGQRTAGQKMQSPLFEEVAPEAEKTPVRDAFRRGAGNRIKGIFGGSSGEAKPPREPAEIIYRGDNPYGYELSEADAEATFAAKKEQIIAAGGEITQSRMDRAVEAAKPEVTVVGDEISVKPNQ